MYDYTRAPQLIADINHAFADTAQQRMEIVVPAVLHGDWEADEVQAAFANKTWPEISLDLLVRNNVYRSFLSEAALYLFLPAFMRESLKSQGIYEVAPPLTRNFSPRPYGQMRDGESVPLDRRQIEVVYKYMKFLADEFVDVFDDLEHAKCTLEYWHRQSELNS